MKGIHAAVLFLFIWCCIKSFNSFVTNHHLDLVDDRARDIYLKDIPRLDREDVELRRRIGELDSEMNRLRMRVERLEHANKNR